MSERPRNLPKRVNDVLARMLLFPEAGAVDYGRDVISNGDGGHGKHGTTTVAPTCRDSLFIEWGDRFHRMCAAAEKAADDHARSPNLRRGETSQQRKRRIVETYVGVQLAEAAFIEGCSTDLIRKTRTTQKRNPEDGTRLPKIGVAEAYRHHESGTDQGEPMNTKDQS